MKKRIGILTLHFAHNSGAMLQAYALSTVINRFAECKIINYLPDYHVKRYRISEMYYHPKRVFLSMLPKEKCSLKDIGKAMLNYYVAKKNPVYINAKNRNNAFTSFFKDLPLSKACYTKKDVEDLKGYNRYIVGSDQIWNKTIFDGLYDPVYFLDFNTKALKYSYAASAEDNLPLSDVQHIGQWTKSFSAISVREKLLFDQFRQNSINCRMDIDPTFLLEKADYSLIEKAIPIDGSFIFVYCFEATNEVSEVTRYLSGEFDCPVVVWGKDEELELDGVKNAKYLYSEGPSEFLYCIHHARYVVTASFHGAAFSIIYKKQFVVLNPIIANNRITTLLEIFHLAHHKYFSNESLVLNEDYIECEELLQKRRQESLKYLLEICCD